MEDRGRFASAVPVATVGRSARAGVFGAGDRPFAELRPAVFEHDLEADHRLHLAEEFFAVDFCVQDGHFAVLQASAEAFDRAAVAAEFDEGVDGKCGVTAARVFLLPQGPVVKPVLEADAFAHVQVADGVAEDRSGASIAFGHFSVGHPRNPPAFQPAERPHEILRVKGQGSFLARTSKKDKAPGHMPRGWRSMDRNALLSVLGEDADAVAAAFFRQALGLLGEVEDFRQAGVVAPERRNADRGRQLEALPGVARHVQVKRAEGVTQAFGYLAGAGGTDAGKQHDEFVSAEAGQFVVGPQHAVHGRGCRLDELVAEDVVLVVEPLEMVQVDEDQAQPAAGVLGPVESALVLLFEPPAVAASGQLVGLGLTFQLLAMRYLAAQVTAGGHDAHRVAVNDQEIDVGFYRNELFGVPDEGQVELDFVQDAQPFEDVRGQLFVVGVPEIGQDVGAGQGARRPADELFRGPVQVGQPAVRLQDDDRVMDGVQDALAEFVLPLQVAEIGHAQPAFRRIRRKTVRFGLASFSSHPSPFAAECADHGFNGKTPFLSRSALKPARD